MTKPHQHWRTSNTVWISIAVTAFFVALVVAAGAFPQYIPSSVKDAAAGGVLAGIGTIIVRAFGIGAQTRLTLRKDGKEGGEG